MPCKIDVKMKSQNFDGSDPITILKCLPTFQKECDANGIHEGVAMWLFHYFVRKTTMAAFYARVTTKEDLRNKKRRKPTYYHEVVHYLLRTYSTEEVIAGADAERNQFRHPIPMSWPDYAQELWTNAFKCGTVCTEPRLKCILIEGLHDSIH